MKIQKINNITNNHITFKSNPKEVSSSENISESRVLPNYDTARAYAIVGINDNNPKYNNVKINEISIYKFNTDSFNCFTSYTSVNNDVAEIQNQLEGEHIPIDKDIKQNYYVTHYRWGNSNVNKICFYDIKDIEKATNRIKKTAYPHVYSEKEFLRAKAILNEKRKENHEAAIDNVSYDEYKNFCEEVTKKPISITFFIPKQAYKNKKIRDRIQQSTLKDTYMPDTSTFSKKREEDGITYTRYI